MKFKLLKITLLISFLLPAAATQAKHVLIYGDSLSAAYGMELNDGWAHLLEQQWRGTHQITNASISGETTHGGLQRLPLTLAKIKPDVILIELGANDGMQGAPISRIRSNLHAMVTLAQQAGAQVVLAGITIPATYGPRYIDEFRAVFTQVAKDLEVAYIDLYNEKFVTTPGYIQADGLHPTAITQPLIRDTIVDFFNSENLLD